MKRVLVTGSSGYIGQHLVKILKNNYQVDGLDLLPTPTAERSFTIDIRELDQVTTDIFYDTVIHLAALVNVGESVKYPTNYYSTNINGTVNVLKNTKYNNFIFASTGAADQLNSPYGISKRVAEDLVTEFCQENKKSFTIFRFYNVIGQDGFSPTNPDGLFFNLMKACHTGTFNLYGDNYNTIDGSCIRDYVHVNEIVNSLVIAITTPSFKIENLGHGKGHSVKEIIDIFKTVNNVNFNTVACDRRPGDIEYSVLDSVSPYMKSLYSIEEILKVTK